MVNPKPYLRPKSRAERECMIKNIICTGRAISLAGAAGALIVIAGLAWLLTK